jgi:hypothetical protein
MRPPQEITTRPESRRITCPDISKRLPFPLFPSGHATTTETRVEEDSRTQPHEDGTSANQSSRQTRILLPAHETAHEDVHTKNLVQNSILMLHPTSK